MNTALSTRGAVRPSLTLGDELDFLRLVWSVVHGLDRASKRMERTLGLTGPQHFVLRVLGRFPGVTLARLAEVLQVHPSTASEIVKRLERRGLLTRGSDTRDRRRAYLGLTPAGRRVDSERAGRVEDAVHRVLSALPANAVDGARRTLGLLASELDSIGDSPSPRHPRADRLPSSPHRPRLGECERR